MKGSTGHVMGWLDIFCWPMGPWATFKSRIRGYGDKNGKCVFLAIFGHYGHRWLAMMAQGVTFWSWELKTKWVM
jgi:hypothetical protein